MLLFEVGFVGGRGLVGEGVLILLYLLFEPYILMEKFLVLFLAFLKVVEFVCRAVLVLILVGVD